MSDMQNRFLFMHRNGQEVEVASEEALARHIEAGDLGEDTLLYDAVTREWAPVRVHPVGSMLLAAVEEALAGPAEEGVSAAASLEPDVPEDSQPSAPADSQSEDSQEDGLLGLDLVPAEDLQGADMVQDFMASREAELEEERRLRGADAENLDMPLVDSSQDTVAPGRRRVAPRRVPRGRTGAARAAAAGSAPGSGVVSSGSEAAWTTREPGRGHADEETWSSGAGRTPGSRSGWGSRSLASLRRMTLLVGLVGVGSWGIRDAWTSPIPPPDPGEGLVVLAPPRPAGPLASPGALAVVSAAAMADMGSALDGLRGDMGVNDPPAVWLSGPYLADASAYPEVARYWERYLELVSAMRAAEEQLFRDGITQRLESEGMEGSALEIRVARALQDFRADGVRRDEEYGAMELLAATATDLDEFLRRSSRSIEYRPAEAGIALDPELEVSIRSQAVRSDLTLHLDRLLDALDRVAGPDPDRRRDVTRYILGRVSSLPPATGLAGGASSASGAGD